MIYYKYLIIGYGRSKNCVLIWWVPLWCHARCANKKMQLKSIPLSGYAKSAKSPLC